VHAQRFAARSGINYALRLELVGLYKFNDKKMKKVSKGCVTNILRNPATDFTDPLHSLATMQARLQQRPNQIKQTNSKGDLPC
jgi:hypothetical protein